MAFYLERTLYIQIVDRMISLTIDRYRPSITITCLKPLFSNSAKFTSKYIQIPSETDVNVRRPLVNAMGLNDSQKN